MTAENVKTASATLADGIPTYIHSRITTESKKPTTRNRKKAVSITQYGVATPVNNSVLVVTADRAEADEALEWIPNGRVVHRTITYGNWLPESDAETPKGWPRTG